MSPEFYDGSDEGLLKQFRDHHMASLSLEGAPEHRCHVFLLYSGENFNGEAWAVAFASGKRDKETSAIMSGESGFNAEADYFRQLHISLRRAKVGD